MCYSEPVRYYAGTYVLMTRATPALMEICMLMLPLLLFFVMLTTVNTELSSRSNFSLADVACCFVKFDRRALYAQIFAPSTPAPRVSQISSRLWFRRLGYRCRLAQRNQGPLCRRGFAIEPTLI